MRRSFRREYERRLSALDSAIPSPERGPDLTDEQARVIRKWDLGVDDLTAEEWGVLREVSSR